MPYGFVIWIHSTVADSYKISTDFAVQHKLTINFANGYHGYSTTACVIFLFYAHVNWIIWQVFCGNYHSDPVLDSLLHDTSDKLQWIYQLKHFLKVASNQN